MEKPTSVDQNRSAELAPKPDVLPSVLSLGRLEDRQNYLLGALASLAAFGLEAAQGSARRQVHSKALKSKT